jgi:hypothetical protein
MGVLDRLQQRGGLQGRAAHCPALAMSVVGCCGELHTAPRWL